jgi:hypothetical protein
MKAGYLFFAALLLTLQPGKAADEASRSTLREMLRDPLPAQMRPDGPAAFYTENLYEYIDGGAELFHSYGLQVLFHQEFKAAEADLTVDVYDMGVPENAFGVYAAERTPGYKFTAIGAEGYQDEGILNFFQGRYYVKLAAFGSGAATAMEQCARVLSERIGGHPALPALLGRFPAERRKNHSESYIRLAPLGHRFLAPAYLASYDLSGRSSIVLVSVAAEAQEAQSRLLQLAEHLRRSGKLQPAPELGPGAIRGENTYEGAMLARAEGRYLVLLLNPGPGAESLLDAVCARLR